MERKVREINPKVSKGDRIMCIHMHQETSVPMGTLGTVQKVVNDPFAKFEYIIEVKWDNGSELGLLSEVDRWIKVDEEMLSHLEDSK